LQLLASVEAVETEEDEGFENLRTVKERFMKKAYVVVLSAMLLMSVLGMAQEPPDAASGVPSGNMATSGGGVVPPVIQFSDVATGEGGKPLAGTVEITFLLYNNFQGGEPLWSETQNVTLESSGHYSVYLGITKSDGVPMSLFTSGEAHWLGVQIAGQAEQPRVFFVSVPYAIKAGDAATVGGLPPSAFALAVPSNAASSTASHTSATSAKSNSAIHPDVSGTGKTGYIPLWTNSTGGLGNSAIFQSSGQNIGIGTITPAAPLTVQSNSANAIYGINTSASGSAAGVKGTSESSNGVGVSGLATSTSGRNEGVIGQSASPSGYGVLGEATSTTGDTVGVYGGSSSTTGVGVSGSAGSASGTAYGVSGEAFSPTGAGVLGTNYSASGSAAGVKGTSKSSNGVGVSGLATSTSGRNEGVFGQSASPSGYGVLGEATSTTGDTVGVDGESSSTTGVGVSGSAGSTSGTAYGVSGEAFSPTGAGVLGTNYSASGSAAGVWGLTQSPQGVGVRAVATAASAEGGR
jgi:trimeric autotransporter adhesin